MNPTERANQGSIGTTSVDTPDAGPKRAAPGKRIGRREWLAGTAATFAIVESSRVRGSTANSTIEVGLIGCGGRGNWIADLFVKNGPFRFVSCADYFEDRVEKFGRRFNIDSSRQHTTLSAYRKLLEDRLDAVVIESPPCFHPEHAAAAVDAGRHIFLAKPIAVDVPGCRIIGEAGGKATDAKRVFLVDFQTRANEHYREAARRIRRGDIGRLVCGEARYPWSGGATSAPRRPEEQLRRWYGITAISGDFIVEQNIHTLDVATWFLDADPLHAVGTGGRKGLRAYGDIWDHFAVIFTFPEDIILSFNSVQVIPGAPNEIPCRIYGSEGLVDTDYFDHVWIRGRRPYTGGRCPNMYVDGAVNNIKDFHRCITEERYANTTVSPSVRSNLTCILGRTAAYERRDVSWDEMMKANRKLELDRTGLKA